MCKVILIYYKAALLLDLRITKRLNYEYASNRISDLYSEILTLRGPIVGTLLRKT